MIFGGRQDLVFDAACKKFSSNYSRLAGRIGARLVVEFHSGGLLLGLPTNSCSIQTN
jgi:hypothetical protein